MTSYVEMYQATLVGILDHQMLSGMYQGSDRKKPRPLREFPFVLGYMFFWSIAGHGPEDRLATDRRRWLVESKSTVRAWYDRPTGWVPNLPGYTSRIPTQASTEVRQPAAWPTVLSLQREYRTVFSGRGMSWVLLGVTEMSCQAEKEAYGTARSDIRKRQR